MKESGWTSHRDGTLPPLFHRKGHHFSRVWGSVHSRLLAHSNLGFFPLWLPDFLLSFLGQFWSIFRGNPPVSFRVPGIFFKSESRCLFKHQLWKGIGPQDLPNYKTLWIMGEKHAHTHSLYQFAVKKQLHEKKPSKVFWKMKWSCFGPQQKDWLFQLCRGVKFSNNYTWYYDNWRWVVFDSFLL